MAKDFDLSKVNKLITATSDGQPQKVQKWHERVDLFARYAENSVPGIVDYLITHKQHRETINGYADPTHKGPVDDAYARQLARGMLATAFEYPDHMQKFKTEIDFQSFENRAIKEPWQSSVVAWSTGANVVYNNRQNLENYNESRTQQYGRAVGHALDASMGPSAVGGALLRSRSSGEFIAQGQAVSGKAWQELYGQKEQALAEMQEVREGALRVATDPNETKERKIQRVRAEADRFQRSFATLATVESAMNIQKAAQLDPESRAERATKVVGRARADQELEGLDEDYRRSSGIFAGKSSRQINEEYSGKQRELIAQEDLIKSGTLSGKGLDEASAKLGKLSDEVEKLGKASKIAGDAAAVSSTKLQQRFAGVMAVTQAAGQVFSGGVTAGIQEVQNRAGYANIENKKYSMWENATHGDVASMMALSGWEVAEQFGQRQAGWAGSAVIANGIGSAFQGAFGGIQVAKGDFWNGPSNLTQGISGTALSAMDLAKGNSMNAAQIQGTQARMAWTQANYEIFAKQSQRIMDYDITMGDASRLLGSGGEAFLASSQNNARADEMANLRLSPKEYAAMAVEGAQNIGSLVNNSNITTARGFEKSGFGSKELNMQLQAQLAGASTGNVSQDFGRIMETATKNALDSSKALSSMVQYSAATASASIGRNVGLDTQGSAAANLAYGIASKADAPNREWELRQATNASELVKQWGTDTGMSFSSMLGVSKMSKDTGTSSYSSVMMQKFDQSTWSELKAQSGDPSKLARRLLQLGVSEATEENAVNIVQKGSRASAIQMLRGGGVGLGAGNDPEAIYSKLEKLGRPITQADLDSGLLTNQELSQYGRTVDGKSDIVSVLNKAVSHQFSTKDGVNTINASGEGGGDWQKQIDVLKTTGSAQEAAAFKAAAAGGDIATATKILSGVMANYEKKLKSGEEKNFSGSAQKAADSMGKYTTQFSVSVEDFGKSVNLLLKKLGGESKHIVPGDDKENKVRVKNDEGTGMNTSPLGAMKDWLGLGPRGLF
jgi:hypothetical protein